VLLLGKPVLHAGFPGKFALRSIAFRVSAHGTMPQLIRRIAAKRGKPTVKARWRLFELRNEP